MDRTAQQPDASADRSASSRVTGNTADDRAARSAACCAAPGIVHRAAGRAAPVKSRRRWPGREELRELHRGFARAAGCHRRRRPRQTCHQHRRQAGRQMSQSVWYSHLDHVHLLFSHQGFGRIAEIRPSLNSDGRSNAFNWRHLSLGFDNPDGRATSSLTRSESTADDQEIDPELTTVPKPPPYRRGRGPAIALKLRLRKPILSRGHERRLWSLW